MVVADLAYYLTFSRMPTLGLDAWRSIYRSYAADGVSRVVLWIGGGFASRRFPETWQYNRGHRNIERDFVGELIDYGHTLGLKTLLGFVPFDYDGINQYTLQRPWLKAIGPDGRYLETQGIHCWGYALNPAHEESRKFVFDYVRELYDDFYPQADGLLVESSDLKLGTGGGDYFALEYELVRELSEDYWGKHPDGEVVVYPHYFRAPERPFDPRWQLVFTSHSAELDDRLIGDAYYSYYADYSMMTGGPADVRRSCRLVADRGISCYFPPFEFFTFTPDRVEMRDTTVVGRDLRPFGLEHLSRYENPYDDPLVAVNRLAARAFGQDPSLELDAFGEVLRADLLGPGATEADVPDLLALQALYFRSKTYFSAGPGADPRALDDQLVRGLLGPDDLAWIAAELSALPARRDRLAASGSAVANGLAARAADVLSRWDDRAVLDGHLKGVR